MKRFRNEFPTDEDEFHPWLGRAVRFVCGAILGALVGVTTGTGSTGPGWDFWLWVIGAAVGCGLLAALLKDEFWKNLRWGGWL